MQSFANFDRAANFLDLPDNQVKIAHHQANHSFDPYSGPGARVQLRNILGTVDQFERQQCLQGHANPTHILTGAATSIHDNADIVRIKSSTFQLGGSNDTGDAAAQKKRKMRANSIARHDIEAVRKRNEKFTDNDVEEWLSAYHERLARESIESKQSLSKLSKTNRSAYLKETADYRKLSNFQKAEGQWSRQVNWT